MKNEKLEWGKVLIPSVLSLLAAIFSGYSSLKVGDLDRIIEKQKQEYNESSNLSKMIIDGMEDFHNKEESSYGKLRFIAVYRMAPSDEDKLLLSRIAIDGKLGKLYDTVASLLKDSFGRSCQEYPRTIQQTKHYMHELNEGKYVKDGDLCAKYVDILSKLEGSALAMEEAEELKLARVSEENKVDLFSGKIDVPPSELQKIVEPPVVKSPDAPDQAGSSSAYSMSKIKGWIYLGMSREDTEGLSGTVTTNLKTIPTNGVKAQTKTSITLRSGYGTKHKVIGYLNPGTEIDIKNTKDLPLSSGGYGWWAEVEINKNKLSNNY